MEPFRFRTAAQAAHEAPTAQKALDYALSPAHTPETQVRLLAGVAQREDLTRKVTKAILKHLRARSSTILRNLLLNPLVAADEGLSGAVVDHMGKDDIFLLATMPGARRYLPRMLTKCYAYGNDDVHLKWLLQVFSPADIEEAVHALVDEWEQALTSPQTERPVGHTLDLRVLGPAHIDRLVSAIGCAVADAATPLGSGRARRRDNAYEARINRMMTVEDVIAHLLVRDDLTPTQSLALIKHAEQVVADAAAYAPPRQRAWARARSTNHMLRNASALTPEATAYAFASDAFRISLTDLVLTKADIEAALIATSARPRPLLVQRALQISLAYSEDAVLALLAAARDLEALRATAGSEGDHEDSDADAADIAWGNRDEAWWTNEPRSAGIDDEIVRGLVRAAIDHIGKPVWEDVYAFTLAQPNQAASTHAVAVDYFAETVDRASMGWSDDSATPVMQKFAAWASASDDAHLRRHAVAQCWSHEQLATVAADPSPLVRIEVLSHDLATADDVLVAASDPDPKVRLAAAKHALLDQRAIALLASDPRKSVRHEVAARVMASLTA